MGYKEAVLNNDL